LEEVLTAEREIFIDKRSRLLPSGTIVELRERVRELVVFMDRAFSAMSGDGRTSRYALDEMDARARFLMNLATGLQRWMFAYEYLESEREMFRNYAEAKSRLKAETHS